MPKESRYWQPPDRLAPGRKRWGWCQEIISDGERMLQGQPFWNDLALAEEIIRGREMSKADENRSDLTSNRLKRAAREMIAAISDVRYPDDIWSTENRAFQDSMTMYSKMARGIWYEARAPYSCKRLTQWFMLGGTGYYWPVYKRRVLVNPRSLGLAFDDYGPRDVVPFQPDERNWQETYAVAIIRMVPEYKAHAMFPLFQDRIRPVSKRRMQSSAVSARMAFINSLRGSDKPLSGAERLVEIQYVLIRDLAINETDMPIPMGEPGASWSYVVPPRGAKGSVPTGYTVGGQRQMRDANIDDARLYPNMRLMINVSGVEEPVYEGPAWDWHGLFPPRFCADEWVTEPMGLSIFRDVFDIERARQFTERAIDMKMKAQMDPALKYDQNVINPGTAEELDPWKMRERLAVDGEVDKVLSTMLPADMYKVGSEPFEWIKYLDESQDYYLGTNQISALAKAKASSSGAVMGGSDSADDLLRLAGPIVRDICAGMEMPMADVLEMEKTQILQWFDTKQVISYVGPDGVTRETLDFDPDSIVPSHMPGEDTGSRSQWSRMERAKNFASSLKLTPTPGYLHGVPQTAQRLLLLQGSRAGLPISPRRILKKVFGIENVDQEIKEWQEFREVELEMAAKLKQEAGSLPGAQSTGRTPAGSQGGKGGRPPSGHKPPAAKTKGSAEGPRATVTESG